MGMFDNLFISAEMLPVTDKEKELIGNNRKWQTKDLDCSLTEVYITDDVELKINRWEYEVVPKEERPHPDAEGILGGIGSLRRVDERLELITEDIDVFFYDSIQGEWYEFLAVFKKGKLKSIERVE